MTNLVRKLKYNTSVILWLLVLGLIAWTFSNVDFKETLQVILLLNFWQILVLITINFVILICFSLRWLIIIKAMGYSVSLIELTGIRIAGFGVSYFTPGPQIGGEPLQVKMISQRYNIPTDTAVSSVFLDKIFEFLINFTVLLLFLVVLGGTGLSIDWIPPNTYAYLVVALILPVIHIYSLRSGYLPLSSGIEKIFRNNKFGSIKEVIHKVELELSRMLQKHPKVMVLSLGVSVLVWVLIIFEFYLMISFLDISLNLIQIILVLTFVRLAFLMPLPAGLGTLEAGQVLAMQLLGLNPALGLAVSLVIRARDVLIGGAGLLLGFNFIRR